MPPRRVIRTGTLSLALAGVALLAACERTPTVTEPDVTPVLANGNASEIGQEASEGRSEFPLRNSPNARAQSPFKGSGSGISYHGGTVLQSGIKLQNIYWGAAPIYKNGPAAGTTGTGDQDASLIGFLLRNLGGSSHYNINTTYTDGSGKPLVNAVSYTSFWANNSNVPTNGQSVSSTQIIAMLQSGFTNGQLTWDPNTLYAVFTAGTVNLGGGAGTQYCAFHSNGYVTVNGVSRRIYYAAMPYNYGWPGGCTSGTASPNADPAADAEINTLVHEIEETQTDALGNAWFDSRGYENADKCAWMWGTTLNNGTGVYNVTIGGKNFLIQQNWINSGSGGCRSTW
jgi:hypothetical protein